MSTISSTGLTSIIVPCCNQRAFTQLCLQALFRYTRPAWKLIAVDDGSTDGTGLYLEGVRDAATVPVTVIANAQNLGFPGRSTRGCKSRAASTWCCSITTRSSPTAGSISSSR